MTGDPPGVGTVADVILDAVVRVGEVAEVGGAVEPVLVLLLKAVSDVGQSSQDQNGHKEDFRSKGHFDFALWVCWEKLRVGAKVLSAELRS